MTRIDDMRTMPALVFEFNILKLGLSKLRGMMSQGGYWRPGGAVGIKEVPVPTLPADDWVLVKTSLSGICGSDMMELTLSGARDNPLRSFITFPQIMGHEPVGTVERVGEKVAGLRQGDRMAISPWFPCAPRGMDPLCPRCKQGDYTHCWNFQRGRLPAGIHLGVATGYGGFAPYVAVHESQCFLIPETVSFEEAVLGDPFAVALHSCVLLEPSTDAIVLVYGLGVIGLATVSCLKNVFNVENILAVGRYPFQAELARRAGADYVFTSSGEKLVEDVAAYTGAELYTPDRGSKWTMDGVDGIIDTVGTSETLEAGMRFMTAQGRLVFSGVATPKRLENTPHYFKELEVVGSNSFAIEYLNGREAHAFESFLDFLRDKVIDLRHLVTHRFKLEDYQDAFDALADKESSSAVKVVFDFSG
jgi:threonine dehydrogenase-like Zn-dependent dehydrogenase